MPKFSFQMRQLIRNTEANVMVELALVMSIFATLLLGGFEVSRMAVQAHEVEQIARSGAQWGLLGQADAADTAAVEAATYAAAGPMADEITATATNFCLCPDDSEINCDEQCADGEANQLYLKVVVTKPYDYTLNLQDLFGPINLSGKAELRVR